MAASSTFRFVLSHGTWVDIPVPAPHSEVSIAPSIQTTWQEIILASVMDSLMIHRSIPCLTLFKSSRKTSPFL